MSKITIDQKLCTRCNNCVEICPFSIYNLTDSDSFPHIIDVELCVSCGHCVALCPKDAIVHEDFPKGCIKPVDENIIPSDKQILELIRSRRSIRVFKKKSVEKNKIEKIIEGACFAPSANNIQNTKFVVVQNLENLEEIRKITIDYLKDIVKKLQNPIIKSIILVFAKNKIKSAHLRIPDYIKIIDSYKSGVDLIIHDAPVLIFFYAEKNIGFSDVNADLALQNASFVCQSLGLGCFYAGYVIAACKQNNRIQRLLNIEDKYQFYGCLAVGYPKYKFRNWISKKPSSILWF